MPCLQIDKNVERELINHRSLLHPNIIRFKEVRLEHQFGQVSHNAPQHAAAGPDHLPAVCVLWQQPIICLHGWGLLMICMGARTPCLPSRGGTPFHALSGPAHRPIHPLRQGVGRRTVAISTGRGSATRSDISSCPQSRTGTSPLAVVP